MYLGRLFSILGLEVEAFTIRITYAVSNGEKINLQGQEMRNFSYTYTSDLRHWLLWVDIVYLISIKLVQDFRYNPHVSFQHRTNNDRLIIYPLGIDPYLHEVLPTM